MHVNANGVRFHVQRIGGGPRTVVFVHGLVMDNLSSFYFTIANPLARTCDVVLYDLRGHGLSERPSSGYSIEDNVRDLYALLDALGVDHPVYLAGNSYGGVVALAFARAHPERAAGLLLLEAHFPVLGWSEKMASTFELAAEWSGSPEVQAWFDEQQVRHYGRRKRSADALLKETTLVRDLREQAPITESDLRSIETPAIAVYGEYSDIIEVGRTLGRELPNCELRELKGIAHTILQDRRHEVRRHLIEWLHKQPTPWSGG